MDVYQGVASDPCCERINTDLSIRLFSGALALDVPTVCWDAKSEAGSLVTPRESGRLISGTVHR